jgi:aspartate racemase
MAENLPKPLTIGILGGMSPESTAEYYLLLVRSYRERYGDHGYPPIIIYSVSFQPYIDWPEQGRWDLVAQGLSEAATRLVQAGAELLVIATNTMHKVVGEVQASVEVPIINLLDVVSEHVLARGMETVGLLGTKFTMEQTFYADALADKGIHVLVPSAADRDFVNEVIYKELVAGQMVDSSRREYQRIIQSLVRDGAQGVILGCTEIPLLISDSDVEVPLFDTTRIHAEAALTASLAGHP